MIEAFKKKKIEKALLKGAIDSHKKRIKNLSDEIDMLTIKLRDNELDIDSPKASKDKMSDILIRKISMKRHEIDIRNEVIGWLS